jgi:hypothetical protein
VARRGGFTVGSCPRRRDEKSSRWGKKEEGRERGKRGREKIKPWKAEVTGEIDVEGVSHGCTVISKCNETSRVPTKGLIFSINF